MLEKGALKIKHLEFTNNKNIELAYDISAGIMAIIAMVVVLLQFTNSIDTTQRYYLNIIDKVIYFIFLADSVVRFLLSKEKKNYWKHNIFDLIAVIPFDLFTASPSGSIFKLLKVIAYFLRVFDNLKDILFTNGFIYSLCATILITLIGSVGIYFAEKGISQSINSFGDALWWSFVTVTTVGYGDISPTTVIGRVIACLLMFSGIGFLGILTSTISTYFITKSFQKNKNKMLEKEFVLDLTEYTEIERKAIISYAEYIKEKNLNDTM